MTQNYRAFLDSSGSLVTERRVFYMLKRLKYLLLAIVMIFSFQPVLASNSMIDTTLLEKGIIRINYQSRQDKPMKITISKDSEKYSYDFNSKDSYPLQFGNGEYVITLLEHKSGTTYKVIKKEKVNLQLKDSNVIYLQSIQTINWNESMDAIKLAKDLTKHAKSTTEKITIIYDYVINKISYDAKKASTVSSDYISSIDETLKNSKGICYDYSILFASMLRSIDIPTKLVTGYKNDVKAYHAWNQVYDAVTKEWSIIDTTYDSLKKSYKNFYTRNKNSSD